MHCIFQDFIKNYSPFQRIPLLMAISPVLVNSMTPHMSLYLQLPGSQQLHMAWGLLALVCLLQSYLSILFYHEVPTYYFSFVLQLGHHIENLL